MRGEAIGRAARHPPLAHPTALRASTFSPRGDRVAGRRAAAPAIDFARFQRMKRRMPLPPLRAAFWLAILPALASLTVPARALVGASPDGRFADRVAMVLLRGPDTAGFCSALVLDSRTLLTAAHCVKATRDMAVHYRDASGAPVIIPVEAAIAHPLYRPDAIRARVVSIDVALIRTARPLDPRFGGAALAAGEGPPIGEPVILTGYGTTRDGDWKSGGELRSVALAVRAPASTVLIWAADPTARSPAPARAIWARRSGRPTAGPRSPLRPGRRRPRPRLRRPDPGAAAGAAQGLDRRDAGEIGRGVQRPAEIGQLAISGKQLFSCQILGSVFYLSQAPLGVRSARAAC